MGHDEQYKLLEKHFSAEQICGLEYIAARAAEQAVKNHRVECPVTKDIELKAWRGFGKMLGIAAFGGGIGGGILTWLIQKGAEHTNR